MSTHIQEVEAFPAEQAPKPRWIDVEDFKDADPVIAPDPANDDEDTTHRPSLLVRRRKRKARRAGRR